MDKPIQSIVLVGSLPGSAGGAGGVAASVQSLLRTLRTVEGVHVEHLNWYDTWRLPLIRPDVVHFNFSAPAKRLLGTFLARIVGARVVHTIHSGQFDFFDYANKLALQLSHGFILLNPSLFKEFSERATKPTTALLTPIFEIQPLPKLVELDPDVEQALALVSDRRIAAVYAYSREVLDGVETYGMQFVGGLLPELAALGYAVLFLDVKGQYTLEDLDPHCTGAAIHVKRPVNFRILCRRLDVYLRPTATDGNSVAVLEALHEGVTVVASNAVPRPEATVLYEFGDPASFLNAIRALTDKCETDQPRSARINLSTGADYLRFLASLDHKSRET